MRSLSAILFAISYVISAHIAPCAVIVRVIATTPDYQAIIQAAVIGHWKLDESSGSALDSGPNGFDLTDNNTVGAATGQVGGGRDFEFSNTEYFSHADNAAFTPSGDFTVCALVKLESKPATDSGGILTHWLGTGNQRGFLFYWGTSQDRFRLLVSNDGVASSAVDADTLGAPATATWYFLCARHNDGVNIEINATALSASSRSATWDATAHTTGLFNSSTTLQIGSFNSGASGTYLDGILDEVGFFDEAISDAALDAYFLKLKAGVGLYGTW